MALPHPSPGALLESPEVLDLSQYKILVVDDEPDVLEFISTVLRDNGATVFEARDGHEAIEVALREKPDLMTLDLQMPNKDGGQVFEEMRRHEELSKIAVCIITGKPELRRLIYQRVVPPPEGFLYKPVSENTLLLNVRKILSLKKRRS